MHLLGYTVDPPSVACALLAFAIPSCAPGIPPLGNGAICVRAHMPLGYKPPKHSRAHSPMFSNPSTQIPVTCTHCTCVLALAMLWVGIRGHPSQHLFPITPPTPACTQEATALHFRAPFAFVGCVHVCETGLHCYLGGGVYSFLLFMWVFVQ
jgi:hypothetical protein